MLVGAIEGGGTKFVCAIALCDSDCSLKKPEIVEQIRIPTEEPAKTLAAVVDFFQTAGQSRNHLKIGSLGLGMFGPIECDPASPRWGLLINTPKPGWAYIDVAQRLQRELGVPVRLETDVAAAALGEWKWGAGREAKICVYVTVGTGIGAGVLVDGVPLRGLFHPEVGHMRVPRVNTDMGFKGVCIHHSDCLEGLASGPAIKARWGIAPEELPAGHPAWELEAEYLALAFSNIAFILSPDRIIVGGGIGLHGGLLDMVADHMGRLTGGYIRALDSVEALRGYLVRAELASEAGILGAAQLGWEAAQGQQCFRQCLS